MCVFSVSDTQGQNIPLKPTRIQIWANNPPTLNNWLILLPFQRISLFCFSPLYSSGTPKRFLHACTPERRTPVLALLFNQRTDIGGQRTPHISFKKNGGVPEISGKRDQRGGASIPHRAKYMGSARCAEWMFASCRLVKFLEVLL